MEGHVGVIEALRQVESGRVGAPGIISSVKLDFGPGDIRKQKKPMAIISLLVCKQQGLLPNEVRLCWFILE
ncbi:MAG: hypothetical protein E6J28_11695, partial [Chloroflexi bacterium]